MGKVVGGMTVSLDGFVNDRHGDVSRLYPDLAELGKTELLQESIKMTGAVVMGRRAYDMAQGNFTGYEFQVPIFVLTHHAPAQAAKGENDALKFHFSHAGIESAIAQAKAAAGDKDVTVVGGASTLRQCLTAGVLDELEIGLVPVLLGQGLRLFETPGLEHIQLESLGAKESPGRIDLRYRVARPNGPGGKS